MDIVFTILFIVALLALIGKIVRDREDERGEHDQVLVRKYKTTASMQRDLNKLTKLGWTADQQTAAAGFLTGTRSYTVTYIRHQL